MGVNMNIQKLEVGKYLNKERKIYQECVVFNFDPSGPILYIFFNKPTDKEIQQIKNDKFEIGLYTQDEIIFILSKFGDLDWMDSPYSVHLSPAVELEQSKGKQGYGLNVLLVDASSGIIRAIRLIGLSNEFSCKLKDAMERQKTMSFNKIDYDQKINRIYSKYNTDNLVNLSSTFYRSNKNA